jgi:hypothetical protein
MYVKLFTSIYQGTLRGKSHGLLVFTNLLAHADSTGAVDVHPNAIADEVGLTVDQVRAALIDLESPDPESRSPENEGRRIIRLDGHRAWGWQIVNYVKYRSIRSEDERREQNRLAQERWRNKNKQSKPQSATVSHDKPMQKQRDKQKNKQEDSNTAPDGVSDSVWQDFKTLRAKLRAPITATSMAGIVREAERAGVSLEVALRTCCERGWRGFKADWMAEQKAGEPAWRTERAELVAKHFPNIAEKKHGITLDMD